MWQDWRDLLSLAPFRTIAGKLSYELGHLMIVSIAITRILPLHLWPPRLELGVGPESDDLNRPTHGIVGRMDHVLKIKSEVYTFDAGKIVIDLENPFEPIERQAAIADKNAEPACSEVVARLRRDAVDGAGEANCIS